MTRHGNLSNRTPIDLAVDALELQARRNAERAALVARTQANREAARQLRIADREGVIR